MKRKIIFRMMGLFVCAATFAARAATNTLPLISDVADQVIALNTSTATNYFTIGDAETPFTELVVTASSSNTNLVPNSAANLILGGNNAQRTIKVTPAAGQQGTASISMLVSDGSNTAGSTFLLTVTPSNTPPTLTGLTGYQIVSPGQIPSVVSFTVGDAETAAGSLQVLPTSSNTNLVPNANLALGGSGANRTVQVTPVGGQKGSAVIKLRVTDALGAFTQSKFIFCVFDAAASNNSFKQPRGLYVLDSTAGTLINDVQMRDANIRNKTFADGYVLRTEWATLEPTSGVFDFTIIDNIFTKLPAGQKLSLLLGSGVLPSWLNATSGVVTYTAGSPDTTTQPVPWDPVAQERFRLLLVALGNHVVDGVPLRDHPRLAAVNFWIPGLKSGIRPLTGAQIRDIPLYSRPLFEGGVLTHLANVTDNFPNVPVLIGFWTYTDSTANPSAWEALRQAILARHDGTTRPRVGFWMENLAANRVAAATDPWIGLPDHAFTAPLYNSQNQTFTGYQVLGSWARPFNSAHVDNLLNGSPEDGMDYGFNDYQCRYYEQYQADVDFANYTAEFQRWHDFLNALPAPLVSNPGMLALSSASYSVAENGGNATITVTRTGGTTGAVSVNYATSNGTATAGSDYTIATGTLNWADGDSASKTFTIPILNDLAHEPDKTVTLTLSNATGSATLGTTTATLSIIDDDPAFTLAVSTGGTGITGTIGSAQNTTLSASGGTEPYAWTIASGTLPGGITLGSNGTLTGTPTTTGTFTITAKATDANGHSDTQTFTVTVSMSPGFSVTLTHNSDGTFTLAWPTTIGGWYQVEFCDDLVPWTWTLLGNSVKATATSATWTDDGTQTGTHPFTATKRFYRVRYWGDFTITFTDNTFTYTDAQRTVTGIFIKPTGTGPFPALIINHGTGGTASDFGLQRANEMSPWGLACIAANLTHMSGTTQDLTTWGYSPENLARILACQAALATRSDVNLNRLSMWGHSRGAFASIGVASDFGHDLKALGFSAGGIIDDTDLNEQSYPGVSEASHITAPTLMFHGSTDPTVPPANSLRLQTLLNTLGVTNTRIVYDTAGITPANNAHNIQNTHFYTDATTGILDQWHAWLIAKGVLP